MEYCCLDGIVQDSMWASSSAGFRRSPLMGVCAPMHDSSQGVRRRLPLYQITPCQSCWLTVRDLVQCYALTVVIAYREELS